MARLSMPWTIWLLVRNFYRQPRARLMLLAFLACLVWWSLPSILPSHGRPDSARLPEKIWIQGAWPRWLPYAWLLLLASWQGRPRKLAPHPLSLDPPQTPGCLLPTSIESLCAWISGEALVRLVDLWAGRRFHVEPGQLLVNLCLSLSALLLFFFLRFSGIPGTFFGLVLGMGLWELLASGPGNGEGIVPALACLLICLGLFLLPRRRIRASC